MRIEWNGGKLTKKRALFLCWKLWEWLAKNPFDLKKNWPEWKANGGKVSACLHWCPCCEMCRMDCLGCPLIDYWGPLKIKMACEYNKNSNWKGWIKERPDGIPANRAKYARRIANAAKRRYEKL